MAQTAPHINYGPELQPLLAQLRAYKKKYYVNQLLRGILIALALLLTSFLAVNAAEYWGHFTPTVRTLLVLVYVTLGLTTLAWLVIRPAWYLARLDQVLSHEEAARQIGKHFPEVADKLLNTLQLAQLSSAEGSLLRASITQKTKDLRLVPFAKAIDLSLNRKYLKYSIPPLAIAIVTGLFVPQFYTEGTNRLVNYDQVFLPKAPFSFKLLNQDLRAYKGEDFEILLQLDGTALPEAVYVELNGRPQKMEQSANGYVFTLRNLQRPEAFRFQAAGFTSASYEVKLLSRPSLVNFVAELNYPAYLGRSPEKLSNVGNFTIPQGTTVRWQFSSEDTDSLTIRNEEDGKLILAEKSGSGFTASKRFMQSGAYEIRLKNEFGGNAEPIKYQAEVIADEAPTIAVEKYQDSTLYNYLLLGGNIADDHGLTKLYLYYKINRAGKNGSNYKGLPIRIAPGQMAQQFVYNWSVDSLNLQPGDDLDYYLQVWDNDGVNGPKATRSVVMKFSLPSARAIEEQVAEASNKAEKQMTNSLRKAESLRRDLQKIEERLRGKTSLNYQDEKAIEDLLKKQQEVRQEVEAMQNQFKQLNEQQNRFEKPNEELAKKLEDLRKIMDQLLDPETKRLYEELQRLLDQKMQSPDQLKNVLDKLQQKETNLNKELDRTLELFKQMQVEQQLNKAIDKLNQLAEQQEKLADKTEQQDGKGQKEPDSKTSKDPKADQKGDQKGDKNKGDQSENKQADPEGAKGGQQEKQEGKTDKQDAKQPDGKSGQNNPDDKQKGNQDGSKDQDQQGDDQKSAKDELGQEQQELQKAFEEIQEDLKKLEEMNKELSQPEKLPDQQKEQQEVEQQQQEAQQNLQKKKNKNAAKNQRQAAKKMKQMAQKMAAAAAEGEQEENEENAEDLRRILDNLLALSFDQEALMKDFKTVFPSDPRYVPLGQKQLKLRDDAKIIEDSLTALAKRVAQISSFITRELGDMKNYMDEATESIKQKRQDVAAGKQQFAMTSMNNLALLLSDVLKQMQDQQQQQQSASAGKGKKKKKKPGQGQSMSQLQKQLNQQIQQLQKGMQQGNQSGQQMSEQLARMAAQQEALRKALAELEKQQTGREKGEKGNGGMGQLKELMEKTEQDLVNKRITPDLIRRQGDILTRLLEAENAQRERELDDKRESKTAKELERVLPPTFADYLKQKQQQVELLKTLPPNLTPFYKQEVTRYFMGIK